MSPSSIFSSNSFDMIRLFRRLMIFSLPIIFIIIIYESILLYLGESMPVSWAIHIQKRVDNTLYLRKYFSHQFNIYKYKLIQIKKPKILILGSSRVMQFRDFMFHPFEKEFLTAGGMIRSVSELKQYVDLVSSEDLPKPEVVIIGVDHWWIKKGDLYNSNWLSKEGLKDDAYNFSAHITAAREFLKRKDFPFYQVKRKWKKKDLYGFNTIGCLSNEDIRGFRNDGSCFYGVSLLKDYIKKPVYIDRESFPFIDRVKTKQKQFKTPAEIDKGKVKILLASIQDMKNMEIEIYIFPPALSNQCYQAIQASGELKTFWNQYIKELKKISNDLGVKFWPYRGPDDYGLSDKYMIDGAHPSEVFIGYYLQEMFKKNKKNSSIFKVDKKFLDEKIQSYDIPLAFDTSFLKKS